FTSEEIEAFEDEIMKELFTKNLDQLKHYRFYLSYNYCLYEQKAQEYSQKLEELHDCDSLIEEDEVLGGNKVIVEID
ncbi:43719_t:CDS:2, partial [Gigaspora margarita]